MTVFSDLAERNARIQRPHVGGPYGEGTIRLQGHEPCPQLSYGIDAVLLLSRDSSTKQYPTQTFPLDIEEAAGIFPLSTIDENAQVIVKFDTPVSNIRSLTIPFRQIFGTVTDRGTPPGTGVTVEGILYFNLLTVDLNSGPFKLEDLTWDLAHQVVRNHLSPSSLYSTASNFRKPNNGVATDFAGFILLFDRAQAAMFGITVDTTGLDAAYTNGDGQSGSGTFWFFDNGANPSFKDDGDAATYTGVHLYFAPVLAGGGAMGGGIMDLLDSSFIRAQLPDPKLDPFDLTGRRIFVAHDGHEVIHSDT